MLWWPAPLRIVAQTSNKSNVAKNSGSNGVLDWDKRVRLLEHRISHAKLMGEHKRVTELTERLQHAQRKRAKALRRSEK